VLRDLRELGGADDAGLLGELIELFLADAPQRLEEIRPRVRNRATIKLPRSARPTPSSRPARNLGATTLSGLCRKHRAQRPHEPARLRSASCSTAPSSTGPRSKAALRLRSVPETLRHAHPEDFSRSSSSPASCRRRRAWACAFLKLTQDEELSADEIGQTILADPALTGRLLLIANSALSAGAHPVTTVSEAIMAHGHRRPCATSRSACR
jgi:hypothetical protein